MGAQPGGRDVVRLDGGGQRRHEGSFLGGQIIPGGRPPATSATPRGMARRVAPRRCGRMYCHVRGNRYETDRDHRWWHGWGNAAVALREEGFGGNVAIISREP